MHETMVPGYFSIPPEWEERLKAIETTETPADKWKATLEALSSHER